MRKAGKQSVKGLGKTQPDPAQNIVHEGAKVPMGKSHESGVADSALLYNEFIVYGNNAHHAALPWDFPALPLPLTLRVHPRCVSDQDEVLAPGQVQVQHQLPLLKGSHGLLQPALTPGQLAKRRADRQPRCHAHNRWRF
jgi:hypothetical protein